MAFKATIGPRKETLALVPALDELAAHLSEEIGFCYRMREAARGGCLVEALGLLSRARDRVVDACQDLAEETPQ